MESLPSIRGLGGAMDAADAVAERHTGPSASERRRQYVVANNMFGKSR